SKFNKQFKEVDLTLSTGVTAELRNKVLNYELDGAFITKNKNTSHKNLNEIEVFNETLVLISDSESKNLSDIINSPILGFIYGLGIAYVPYSAVEHYEAS